MGSMSYRIAIVYTSITGNTKELVDILGDLFLVRDVELRVMQAHEIRLNKLNEYDAIVIGSYTWGNGEIPPEMLPLYRAFEEQEVKSVITGIVGTGDQFYPYFCGAVDEFRDMLYVHTGLAATLKVELAPQAEDKVRCQSFVEVLLNRLEERTLG
ncbi:flavodoxin domain-containing protein [Bacillus sp. CGMCC 1.16607]|uniref:flavodoxin domain-containing protein n=1 Tax=Bacillus sp. CGMCC 1.16607 TaxID=3351842 RepID=UPI00362A09C0